MTFGPPALSSLPKTIGTGARGYETRRPETGGDPSRDLPRPRMSGTTPNVAPRIRCLRMETADIDGAVDFLARGFPNRLPGYWRRGLARMRERATPDTCPRYGMVMTADDAIVGIVLLIFSHGLRADGTAQIRANISSWCVDPAYRAYSSILLAPIFKMKNVTLFNISAVRATIETLEAQGFSTYARGTFLALAALGRRVPGARIRRIEAGTADADPRLVDQAALGCLVFEITAEDKTYPFVFLRRRLANIPCAQLIYCPDMATFTRFSGALGRRLLRFGLPIVMMAANGPVDTMVGFYLPGRRPQFYRGEMAPALGDLRDTELVIFGP